MYKMDLEALPEYHILEFLERLPDEELMSFCDQPISKKIDRSCKLSPELQKRIFNIKIKPIKTAHSLPYNDFDNVYSDDEYAYFTGSKSFDYILTRMSQVRTYHDWYEKVEENRAETYQDSILFKLYIFRKEDLVDTLNLIPQAFQIDTIRLTDNGFIDFFTYFNGKDLADPSIPKWRILALFGMMGLMSREESPPIIQNLYQVIHEEIYNAMY